MFSRGADIQTLANDWLASVADERDLLDEAFAFIAGELNEPQSELRAAWSVQTDRERVMWLDDVATKAALPLRSALLSLGAALATDTLAPEPFEKLRALLSWLPQRETLVLGIDQAGPAALRAALAIATETPTWALLVTIAQGTWTSVIEQLDDRGRTVLEAGVLPTLSPPRQADAAVVIRELAPRDLRLLAADALSKARTVRGGTARDVEALGERARSLAELRLFELLQADSTTHGLFELNRRMPFTFGACAMEVDLACVELRLAVEVDGYHHFRESSAYRRDRRKDVVLQHQGYLVSRHLATDVVERAGEVVRAIRTLVLRRRRTLQRENATR